MFSRVHRPLNVADKALGRHSLATIRTPGQILEPGTGVFMELRAFTGLNCRKFVQKSSEGFKGQLPGDIFGSPGPWIFLPHGIVTLQLGIQNNREMWQCNLGF